jgi:hypothetical protein
LSPLGALKFVVSNFRLCPINSFSFSITDALGFLSALRRQSCRSDPLKLLHPSTLIVSTFF